MYKKIRDNTSLVRDTESKAVLNTNPDEYIAAKQRKNRARRERKELEELRSEVKELKGLIEELRIFKDKYSHDQ